MSLPPKEDGEVVARIRNPVVDDWNDTPEDAAQTAPMHSGIGTLPPEVPRSAEKSPRRGMDMSAKAPAPVAAIAQVVNENVLSRWVPVMAVFAVYAIYAGFQESLGNVSSPRLSSPAWRFGIVGQAAPGLLKVMLGVSLATLALLTAERKIASRIVMWLLALGTLALLAVVPFFLLDALEVRPSLPSRMSGKIFAVSVAFAVFALLGATVVMGTCIWSLRGQLRRLKLDNKSLVDQAWDR